MSPKPKKKSSNRMAGTEVQRRFKDLDPIPPEARDNPVEWASQFAESMIPHSVKELEWQLKFGDSKSRKEVALEFLAFKGISNRGPNTGQVVPAIQLVINGALPWSQAQSVGLPSGPTKELVEGQVMERVVVTKGGGTE